MPPVSKDELLRFQTAIEKLVVEQSLTYLEAVLQFCEDNDLDIEKIPRLLSSVLKEKLTEEASEKRLIKKEINPTRGLPFV